MKKSKTKGADIYRALLVFLLMNGGNALVLSITNSAHFRRNLDSLMGAREAVNARERGIFGFSAFSNLTGLGMPGSPIFFPFNFPALVATMNGHQFSFFAAALTGSSMIFFAVTFLSRSYKFSWSISLTAGWLLQYLIIMPTPLVWTYLARFSGTPFVTALFYLTLFTGCIVRSGSATSRRCSTSWSVTASIFGAMAIWGASSWILMSVPVMTVILGISVCSSFFSQGQNVLTINRPLRYVLIGLGVATTSLPIIWWSLSNLFYIARVLSTKVNVIADINSTFYFFDAFGEHTSYHQFIKWSWLTVIALGLLAALFKGTAEQIRAVKHTLILSGVLIFYSLVYFLFARSGNEIGMRPAYMTAILLPYFAIVCAFLFFTFCAEALRGAAHKLSVTAKAKTELLLVYAPLIISLLYPVIWTIDNRQLVLSYDASSSSVSEPLLEQINGSILRDILPQPDSPNSRVLIVQGSDSQNSASITESIHTSPPLHQSKLLVLNAYKGVPFVNAYSYFVPPYSADFFSKFFAGGRSIDQNLLVATEFDETAARLAGIGFVVSERALPSPFLRLIKRFDGDSAPYVYEVVGSTIEPLTPVREKVLTTLKEVLDELSRPTFDPQEEVLTWTSLGDLVVPETVKVTMTDNEIRVTGFSKSKSVVVVPVEYSDCQEIRLHSKLGQNEYADVIPVNGFFTGVVFSGKIDMSIRYVHTPFQNIMCRFADTRNYQRLAG